MQVGACPRCGAFMMGICATCFGRDAGREIGAAIASVLRPQRRSDRTNQYGGKCVIKYNPTVAETIAGIKQSATILDWQSEDGQPHVVTIELGRIASGGGASFPRGMLDPDPSTGQLRPLSYRGAFQVLVGTPGTMQDVFYLDIGRGQRLTVAASYVAITAEALPPPTALTPDGPLTFQPGSMTVAAGLGYGAAFSMAPLYYTQYIDLFEPDDVRELVIPPWANTIASVRCSDPTTQLRIDVQDNAGLVIQTIGPYANSVVPFPSVPIPGDAYAIQVKNVLSVGETVEARVVYQITT